MAGPAIAIGQMALRDTLWAEATRIRLGKEAIQLSTLLTDSGLAVIGGTSLFQLVETPSAAQLFFHLGRAGILVRRFTEQPNWLRFGLPAGETARQRLRCALDQFATNL